MRPETYISFYKEKEGRVDVYSLAPGVKISFNQIHTSNWMKGDSSVFLDRMLVVNFCLSGRCDVSLTGNRYAIVGERQICISTILPTKDFYYPGRLYEGIQLYIDRNVIDSLESQDFPKTESLLAGMGVHIDRIIAEFCGDDGLYLHRMNDAMLELTGGIWQEKDKPDLGNLRYLTIRLLHEIANLSRESESGSNFTRSQIAIVEEAESIIMQDLSRRITAKEMADRFGISESSFKLYIKGILGGSYLSYFRKKRMEKAAGLLKDTQLKVIEIANMVGYENQGKFAKVFAEIYKVTPLEYRRLSK